MKFDKKVISLSVAGFVAITMVGCGGGSSVSGLDTEPGQPITLAQAKDAMALNAIAYRVITPLYGTVKGIVESSASTNSVDVRRPNPYTVDCEMGGTYTETYTEYGIIYEYDNCKTDDPNGTYEDPMVDQCLAIGASIFPFAPTSTNDTRLAASGTDYYAIINGKVTCEAQTATSAYANLENYMVTAYNSTLQDPNGDNRWAYNMRVDISYDLHDTVAGNVPNALYTLKVDGDIRGQKWDGSSVSGGTLVNDETWSFDNLTVEADHQGAGKPDILRASGTASYLGAVREGDTGNNGMELSVSFDKYAYQFNPTEDIRIENIEISGKVQASCHPDWITYATPEVLVDEGGLVNGIKDAEGDRMPHAGMMTIATESTTGEAEAEFADNGTNAEVTITAEDGAKTYESWRSIIEGSSCQVFQDIIDGIVIGG